MNFRRVVSWLLPLTVALTVALAQDQAPREPAPPRPHIVILLCDDAGYADFSMHGATDIATPRIDSIAADGVRFTNGYVTGTVCSPTRAGLLTGRYQQRFGHETNIPPVFHEANGLPLGEQTIADHLRGAGYRTIALGKWHLGYADKFHPLSRGFDDYFGFLQGARSYVPLEQPTRLNRLQRDREVQPESFDYMTDELGQQAAKYIADRGDKPLLLYVAFNAVHTPMQALERDLEGAEGKPKRRKLIAMTRALDRAVGTVLDALDTAGIADDTLLFFLNDNGGATNNASNNAPLRGRKGQVFEGGIRVPFVARWPGRLPKGVVYDEPVIALDLAATALVAAGAKLPDERPLDGVDLVPFLTGDAKTPPHQALFWRQNDKWAVRVGNWKLLREGNDNQRMLFDLAVDPGEQNDLAAAHPERVAELRQRFNAWNSELVEPLQWRR